MKINFFKKKNNFKKKSFEINPNFYWEITVLVILIVIVAFFVFGYCLFVNTNQEFVLSTVSGAGQVGTVNKDRIEKVLNLFSERAQTSTEILSSGVPVVDPSI